MSKFSLIFTSCLALVHNPTMAFVVPSSSSSSTAMPLRTTTALAQATGSDSSFGESNKPPRSDTSRLQMSDTTMEDTSVVSNAADLVDTGNSFQSLMQDILKEDGAPVSFSADDLRLLKQLLAAQQPQKSKFEQDAYWAEVRKPVDEATTIPPEVFRSQEFYDLEHEKILSKTWVCVGTADQVRHHGDVISVMVAGKPILVTRTKDGQVRGFYNVCRHRGARLLNEGDCGKKTCISCPYHSWGYGLDGKLLATPNWNTNPDGHKRSKPGTMMANSGTY